MSYEPILREHAADAEQLEKAYQQARQAGEAIPFKMAVDASYTAAPDNLLYAAWHYRLAHSAGELSGRVIAWAPLLLLALLNGSLLWWLSDPELTLRVKGYQEFPYLFLAWSPITAGLALLSFALVRKRGWLRVLILAALLGALSVYARVVYERMDLPVFQDQYLTLASFHLPLLAWLVVGIDLLWQARDVENRFAFLAKSLTVFVTGGLLGIALGVLTAITTGLFQALEITLPDAVTRLFVVGGGGMLPLLAVALVYAPERAPVDQPAAEGLSKLIGSLMRALLAPTLLVLVVYAGFIPTNFFKPFENRDVLIIFNAMLFAVAALMIGATPTRSGEMSNRVARWLRRGLIALALLAFAVGVYALAAIAYRTAIDRLTPNRLTFIGWNVVNIGLLLLLLITQLRARQEKWLHALHALFAGSAIVYAIWALVVTLAIPWLFNIDKQAVATLPESVQAYVYAQPGPILLKCADSPHIYALEDGAKRWIKDIATFEAQGYRWSDVNFVSCADLAAVPDGLPIPPDAGSPPQ